MDVFSGILPFVYAAEEQSFRRAAERLAVTPAAISKAISRLEEQLGVRLLHRTSRSVSLTDEGTLFLQRCKEAVQRVQEGRELVSQSQRIPRGTVTLSASFILGRILTRNMHLLTARFPSLQVHLHLSDRFAKLADEKIDVAVRIGNLEDSSLVTRHLASTRWATLASPAYLAEHGTPKAPQELAGHNCIRFIMPQGTARDWSFKGQHNSPKIDGNLRVDHGEMLLVAAESGLGICQVLDFMAEEPVKAGRLVEVLADHAAGGPPIQAVMLPGRRASPRIRAVLQWLVDVFRTE